MVVVVGFDFDIVLIRVIMYLYDFVVGEKICYLVWWYPRVNKVLEVFVR